VSRPSGALPQPKERDVPQLEIDHGDLEVRFPHSEAVEQDEEWCEIEDDGEVRRIRFHDYGEIYKIPGLYERIFYDALKCCSPQAVIGLLAEQLRAGELLRAFDVGAGNGMAAEQLDGIGTDLIVGADIIPEAAMAAERDRPGLYEAYHVVDLTDIPPGLKQELREQRFNCLVTVAALGFGDMPPEAFASAYNFVENGGCVAFNIKSRFLNYEEEKSGFAALIKRMLDDGTLELCAEREYRHRLSVSGEPLNYVAMVARKRADVTA
jgi:predicted TPR repeat methyltransferase